MEALISQRGLFESLCAFALILLIGGCSDGSDSNPSAQGEPPSEPTEQTLTGYLVDSAVFGVTYETSTQKGSTGTEGDFLYLPGETVRFTIGDTLLGEVPGQEQVTPFDLANSEVPTGTPAILAAIGYEDHPFPNPAAMGQGGHAYLNPAMATIEDEEHPFHQVVNLAVLLQSLDGDGEPANGIEILPEVAALFDGVALDLSLESVIFENDQRLVGIVRRANAGGLFTENHGVVRPAVALEHLYEAIGVAADIFVPSRWEWINGEDPSDHEIEVFEYGAFGYVTYEAGLAPDGTAENVNRNEYDSRGNLIAQEIEPFDECPPGEIRWQYDAGGNLTRIAWNWDFQGMDEYTEQLQYGPDGSAAQLTKLDWGGEGTPDWVCGDIAYVGELEVVFDPEVSIEFVGTEVAYASDGVPEYLERIEFDAYGNATLEEIDENGDGVPDSRVSREYDAAGNETRFELDEDGDDAPDEIRTYEYGADGSTIRQTWDEDGDGTPELIQLTEADPDGLWSRHGYDDDGDGDIDRVTYREENHPGGAPIRREYDRDGDGIIELLAVAEVDAEGRELHTTVSHDLDDDGVVDLIRYDERDENWRVLRSEEDHNADGIPERMELYQYHPSGQVKRIEEIRDSDGDDGYGDGTPDEVEVEEYDVNGNQILRESDSDGDGQADEVERWEYDDDGRLVRSTEDEDNDGKLEVVETWEYDEHGNLTRRSTDDEGDGTVDGADSWQYEYDADGRVTRRAWDEGDDGTVDLVESWQYDAYGNLLRAEFGENLNTRIIEYVPGSWGAFYPSEPPRDPRSEFSIPEPW